MATSNIGQLDEVSALRLTKSRVISNFLRIKYQIMEYLEEEVTSKEEMKRLRSDFNKAMDEAMSVSEKYCEVCDDTSLVQSTQEELEKLLVAFDEIQNQILNYGDLKSNTSDKSEKSENEVNNNLGQDMFKQLKRISIPMFYGDKKMYESWKAVFTACVDNSSLTAEYKLLQLRQYLGGEALKAIEQLGHSAASYKAAKDKLDRKYGGERRHIAVQFEQIDKFRPIRENNAKDIERFADLIDILFINLSEASRDDELGNGTLYLKLLRKLPEPMIRNYQRWIFEFKKKECVESLKIWINQEAEFQMMASETARGLTPSATRPTFGNEGTFNLHVTSQSRACPCCNSRNHGVWNCEKFKTLSLENRWRIAKESKLCFRCLGKFHDGKNCKRTRICGINNCPKTHHRLLHQQIIGDNHFTEQSSSRQLFETTVSDVREFIPSSRTTMQSSCTDIALRTVPVILKSNNKSITVNALLDDGSTQTYINADVAAELELNTNNSTSVSVRVLNGQTETFRTMPVELTLQNVNGTLSKKITALTTRKVTGDLTAIDWIHEKQKWPHLNQIYFPRICQPQTIDILIGIDYADLHCSMKEIRGKPGEPVARLTPLGWTCVGKVSNKEDNQFGFLSTFFLDLSLRKFWEVEEVINNDTLISKEEQRIIDNTRQSMTTVNGHYQVKIPWKSEPPLLPSNYDVALQRLENTEKRLEHLLPEIKTTYRDTIQQYEDKGYIQKVDSTVSNKFQKSWFLPHFPVVRLDKSTTKTRIVFDASAKCKGTSLNEHIDQGPKLQRELFDVLLRFRKNPIGIVCDIAEMYLRIEIDTEDRPYFQFLWRDCNSDIPPDVYQFTRVVFGANCSPFLAQFVSQENARNYSSEFPLAAKTVLKSTYMDDSMDSVLTDIEAVELYSQLIELWKKCGMHARKWLSNSELLMSQIPEPDRGQSIDLNQEGMLGVKTLGVNWIIDGDKFTFNYRSVDDSFVFTKRNILKKIAMIFDPLGFLSPFIIRAKILMQKIWLSGTDWDEIINDNIISEVKAWMNELHSLNELSVERCLRKAKSIIELQLHVFVDASCDAYGAVVYTRCSYDSGEISTHFVCSKTKVAPLKSVSIPRLELMAAILGLRLTLSIISVLNIAVKDVIFWSDSTNVLWWIRSNSRSYKPFVANRIGEIQLHSDPCQWRYIPTNLNPADLASRGVKIAVLVSEAFWWKGPDFLHQNSEYWPPNLAVKSSSTSSTELKKSVNVEPVVSLFVSNNYTVLLTDRLSPSRYSNWSRYIRTFSWVLRFIDNCRLSPDNRKSGELQSEEINDAEIVVFRACQQEQFESEYCALISQKPISSKSKLLPLNPQLDEDGIIRSSSRVIHSNLPYDARYPIILPRHHAVTRLIIQHEHCNYNHTCGTNHILSVLSNRFWIEAGREAIREVENSCSKCKRRRAKAATQIMAPLPASRLHSPEQSLRCFVHTAVDFAGPFITKQGRGKTQLKRYLCLFTCMSTRAVHLEMAYGLDTDSFMKAFYRFVNRRGWPEEMTSDNGTNFVGCQKELISIDQEKVKNLTAVKKVKWHFNPPAASHFGGVFEIMIKAAKRAIKAILQSADITDEELMSAFIGAESLLNSRPITYQSANPNDILPLTPNHFLLCGEVVPTTSEDISHPRKRWRRIQQLTQHFWHRWMQEWIPGLRSRKKWRQESRDFSVGDIVIVMQQDTVRGHWPLGRITEVYHGSDGHVRVANVKIGQTIFKRPITSLCPLELGDK